MDKDNKNYNYDSNVNKLFIEIINDLREITNKSMDIFINQKIIDIITKINIIIKEKNDKKDEQIRNFTQQLFSLQNKIFDLNKKMNESIINNINVLKEIKYDLGKYLGEVKNGLPEGKGDMYWTNGDRYIGEWKNGLKEGKGIMYWNTGDRYEGDFRNGGKEGKGIYYNSNGDRYEGDWRNDKKEGQGIYYYNNGDRIMGDYSNDEPIGKHVLLTKGGKVKVNNY